MELRRIWFPILLAAVWVVLAAATLAAFAGFAGATAPGAAVARLEQPTRHAPVGRRPAAPRAVHRAVATD
jgi:hypothetical protein